MNKNYEKLHYDSKIWRETRLVRNAIKRLGAEVREPEVRINVQNTDTDAAREGRLTFRAFHLVFPDLPMTFAAPPVTRLYLATAPQVADLLANPHNSRLVHSHAGLRTELAIASDRPLGLVFRYGRIYGGNILHDGDRDRFGGGTPIHAEDRELVYNRFYTVLDAIASGGIQSIEAPANTQAMPFDPGLPIPPSMRRRLGCGVAAQVVALVDQVCSRQLPRDIHQWAHWIDGERWARCSQQDMARLIGCTPGAIKKAVGRLVGEGMLERRQTVEGNVYRLGPALRQDNPQEAP